MKTITKSLIIISGLLCLHQQAIAQCPPNDPLFVTNNGNVGFGTLSWAINCANTFPNLNEIHFDLPPGNTEIVPTPSGPIPPLFENDIVIDARTQPVGTVVLNGEAVPNQNGFVLNGNNCQIFGFHITNFMSSTPNGGAGVAIDNGDNQLIQENFLTNNNDGIRLQGGGLNFTALMNTIGEDPQGNPFPNTQAGIAVANTFGTGTIEDNVIAHNPIGVEVLGPSDVLITENQFYCNTNEGINKILGQPSVPTITSAMSNQVTGTGTAGAIIEVFVNDNSVCSPPVGVCQGNTYLGTSTVAATGNWTLSGLTLIAGQEVTATSTDGGNTSEFSSCFIVTCTGITITTQPINLDVECIVGTDLQAIYQNWINTCGGAEAFSDCDPLITCQPIPIPPPPMPDVCGGSVSLQWTFTDGMGNTAVTNPATFTILPDNTIPTISGVPVDITVSCDNVPAPANPTVTDNCDDNPILTFTETNTPSAQCPQNYTLVHLWTATDACGNQNVAAQTITVEDNVAPTFTVPADITVVVGSPTDPSVTGDVTDESDNCDPEVADGGPTEAIFSDTQITDNCDVIITRTWTLTDACGNNTTETQTITVAGEEPTAVLTGDAEICEGDATDLTIFLTGTPPYTINYTENGIAQPALTNIMSSPFVLTVSPPFTSTYAITTLFDANCEGTFFGTPTVTVNPNPEAFPAFMFECEESAGQATFDLTTIEDIVNGGTGLPVEWYEDIAISVPIANPTTYSSGGGFVYAIVNNNGCISNRAEIELFVISLTASCAELSAVSANGGNDGSAVIEITTGGTPNYNYDWAGDNGLLGSGTITAIGSQDTLTNLEAGNYSVTFTDAEGCTTTCTFSISEPPPVNCTDFLIDTSYTIPVSCAGGNDGSLYLELMGGTSPFIFEWNDTTLNDTLNVNVFDADSLLAGTYFVTITDSSSCQLLDTLVITQPDTLSFSCTQLDSVSTVGGNNGSAVISFSGGTAPYYLSWAMGNDTFPNPGMDTLLNLSAGTYTLTLMDSLGCDTTCMVTITEPNCDDFLVDTSFVNHVSCFDGNDGSLEIILEGGLAPYIFEWNNSSLDDTISTDTFFADNLTSGSYFTTITDSQNCRIFDTLTIAEPSELLFACDTLVGTTPPGESLGEAIINFSGGTAPYFITFLGNQDTFFVAGSDTFTNLPAGSYTVFISDANNCTENCTFSVVEFDPDLCMGFGIDTTIVENVSCAGGNDGSLQIQLIGGIPAYQFLWNEPSMNQILDANIYSANQLTAGIYLTTIIDGNDCTLFDTIIITEPPVLQLDSFQIEDVSCANGTDGSIEVFVNGGTPPYQVVWNTGAGGTLLSNLSSGVYDVTISDVNDCVYLDTFLVTEPPVLQINSSTVQNVSCQGGTDGSLEILVVGGSPPYQIIWNTGDSGNAIANLSAGSYDVTISDMNDCILLDTFIISEPPPLQIDSAIIQNETCLNDANGSIQVFVSGGTGAYNYQWDSGETTDLISNLNTGNYEVSVTDANNCLLTASYDILPGTAPSGFFVEAGLTGCAGDVFPLTLDLTGASPFNFSYSDGQSQFDLTNVLDGQILNLQPQQTTTYSIISITDANGCVGTSLDTAVLTVNHLPAFENAQITCDGDTYTVVFQVNSDLPFGVGGNSVADISPDGVVTSNPIPIMTAYEFFITNDCGTVTLDGNDDCDCLTFAGNFVEDTIQVCEGTTVFATHENAILDNNDLLIFVLQTASGNLQMPLASNNIPSFGYNAQLAYDTPYYIFAIAGNDDGTGNIDFDDPCLSVVQGTVVIFNEQPPDLLWVSGQEMLCGGEDLILETEAWSVDNARYYWLLPNGDTIITVDPSLIIPNVTTQDSGQYFVLMEWGNCLSNPLGFHHLEVNAPPSESVELGADIVLCDINAVVLNAPSVMLGCVGIWKTNSTAEIESPFGTQTMVNNLEPGVNEFIWSVSCGACEDAARDTIIVHYAIPPIAVFDRFVLEKAQDIITMNVLRNDQVDALDSLEMTIVTPPERGELVWLPDAQTFQYSEPSENYTGEVEFVYEVCNGWIDTCMACDTALVLIQILNFPKVPEALTPNNDGLNDVFSIIGLNEDHRNELIIINRWGSVVFEDDDYSNNNPWYGDLNRNGKTLEQGAYYYQLTVYENNSKVFQETGVTYIIQRE